MLLPRLSLNANAESLGDPTPFLEFVTKRRPPSILLMSDWKLDLANQVLNLTERQTRVIVRLPNNNEKDEWGFVPRNIDATIASWRTLPNAGDVYFHVLNEPILFEDYDLIELMLDWLIEFMDKARHAGLHLTVGNFDMSYTKASIEAGVWDDFLRAVARHKGWHTLGVHIYGTLSKANSYDHPANWYLDREKVQPAYWPNVAAGHRKDTLTPDGKLPEIYFEMRPEWFVIWSHKLGLATPDLDVTEAGFDGLQGIGFVYDELRNRGLGLPEYLNDFNGHRTYRKVWEYYWPEWSYEDAMIHQWQWVEDFYAAHYKSFMWFTYTSGKWTNYNLNGETKLFNRLLETNTPAPVPTPEPEDKLTYDIADYLGSGKLYELANTWNAAPERVQTQRNVNGDLFIVKNAAWEHIGITPTHILRGVDTSPGGNEMYILFETVGVYGSKWCPRRMAVGEVFKRSPTVIFYDKKEERETRGRYVDVSWLKLEKYHAKYFISNTVTIDDVLQFLWSNDLAGQPLERYYYARGYGLIKWQDVASGRQSYFTKELPGVPSLTREQTWLSGKLPVLSSGTSTPPPVPPPTPAPVRTPRTFHAEFDATDDEHERLVNALRAVINVHMMAGK